MTNNKAFCLITGLVLVVGLLGFIPTVSPLRTSQEIACKLMAIFFISLVFINNIWLKLFLAYCVSMVFINTNPQSLIVLQTLFFFTIFFQVLANNLNEKRIYLIFDIICFIGLVQSIMMLLQYIGVWFIYLPLRHSEFSPTFEIFKNTPFTILVYTGKVLDSMRWNIVGFTSNPNIASALLAFCIPACLRKNRKWILLFLIPAIIYNHSLQGIIGAIVIILSYVIYKIKDSYDRILFLSILIPIVGIWIYTSGNWKLFLMPDRLPIWNYCLTHIIPQHPFMGMGLGIGQRTYKIIESVFKMGVSYTHPHNEYIFLIMETGIIGFGLMMIFIFRSIYKFIRTGLNEINILVLLGIISGLLNFIVSFSAHVTIMMVFIVYLSIMQYENQTEVAR